MKGGPFPAIAIVGRACVLPGALSPQALWAAVAEGRDLIRSAPPGRWGIPREQVLCSPDSADADRSWSDRGGYVSGFEGIWDPNGFGVPAAELAGLDPLVHWVLHTARAALLEVACAKPGAIEHAPFYKGKIGAIFGNLGFPSPGMAEYAQGVWTGSEAGDSRNRFMSSGTALLLERALALDAGSFCLDAACASSLYAIKLACDRLQDGSADLMLAGAVQGADDLFLHMGFCALNALSRSGRSRPFHAQADGLLPAEGAAFVALKRLADARRDGDHIHGVIRGIGLSNDGRGKGLLAPAEEGQRRAMRAAFAGSGIRPEQVSLLECHATGTPVGDATELRSTATVYAAASDLPIGSLKSNLGHLITTAGVAGLIKVLEAMRAGQRPPTLHVETPNPALDGTPFRLIDRLEIWPSDGPPRIAAISAFGFGGNNAHLLVSEDAPEIESGTTAAASGSIAIVGLGCVVASAASRREFSELLFSGAHALDANGEGRMQALKLELDGLRFPPKDLALALPQQLALLQASREALAETAPLPRESTGIFIGMEPDPEVARYGLRWRLAQPGADPQRLTAARDTVVAALESAAVLGSMPNIPANRLSSQFDLGGPAFTVQAGPGSGAVAIDLAIRGLQSRELDAAIVGAVDLSCEAVQRSVSTTPPGDAAVVLVLKRFEDAERDGDRVYALMDPPAQGVQIAAMADPTTFPPLTARFGDAYAASGLVQVAAAALSLHHRRKIDGSPWLSAQPRQMSIAGDTHHLQLREAANHPPRSEQPRPRLRCFSGANLAQVLGALRSGTEGLAGVARLVLVAADADFERIRLRALAHLETGAPAGSGIHFAERPMSGEIAFVFAGAGASYRGMGRELLLQFPLLATSLATRSQRLATALTWSTDLYPHGPSAIEQLWGASALSQLHLELTRGLLGIEPVAWLGYSSGETNALVAAGIWTDADELMTESEDSGLMTHELGGEFAAVARRWGRPVDWASWVVLAPVDEVRAAISDTPSSSASSNAAEESRVHLAIVHSDQECLIAGDASACERVIERIGAGRCMRLVYPLAVHVPELEEVAAQWRQLHRRATHPLARGRIYSNALGAAYEPTMDSCAQAILDQATQTLDLRPAILSAWNDGVRIFIEHGPGGSYGRAIRDTLGERAALIVSLDRKAQGIEATLGAVAALLAAGVPMRLCALEAALRSVPVVVPSGRVLEVSAHPPAIELPPMPAEPVQVMRPAPKLPPVIEQYPAIQIDAVALVSSELVQTLPIPLPIAMQARSLQSVRAQAERVWRDITASDHSARSPWPLAMTCLVPPQPSPSIEKGAGGEPERRSRQLTKTTHLVTPGLDLHQSQRASLAAIHQQFVTGQQAVHEQFLSLQGRAIEMLFAAASELPANARAPGWIERPAIADRPEVAQAMAPPDGEANTHFPSEASASENPLTAAPRGLRFTREQLQIHSSGRISEIFGPQFAEQDQYRRQVRMPRPPLLLADRVIGLDAQPASMGKGTIWTETDVSADAWYLHHGRMPAGVMIEAGQADLMLISYLGVDLLNRGERVYRLLGCELTYHGDLPRVGDTLRFDIHLDGHAAQGDVRLMFFHYDCFNGERAQLSVRQGQAGFFTDEELRASAGCLWSPQTQAIVPQPCCDAPQLACSRTEFSRAHLEAFAAGDSFACFGLGFERAQTHTRSPGIHAGAMLLQDRVTRIEMNGGPWRRGYLRAELDIRPDQWFFDGHFKNDPCMPGTLMFEGCLQMLAFYLAAHGYSVDRDGWRFQPVPQIPYQLQCRGQVTPSSRLLVTEIFVEEISAGPIPTVYADLLCSVDGLKAFHARRVGLQLVPDWPFEAPDAVKTTQSSKLGSTRPGQGAAVVDGFRFDQQSLLACAQGRPSHAFGPMYTRFDGPMRVARLPSPPYLFASRVTEVSGQIGVLKAGARCVIEYDVPADAWYFQENGSRVMPFAVLLEAALQPCGWLSSYVGSALTIDTELGFRNLDGKGTLFAEVLDDSATLRTEVELLEVSATAGMIIESFAVRCFLGVREVYALRTVFGFFPPAALAAQAGLPTTAAQREILSRESEYLMDLSHPVPVRFHARCALFESNTELVPGAPRLRMLDRVDGWWSDAGVAGLGQLRAVKDIDANEWFFKAHFFQDPVQPGSLGIEAMIQLLQFYMLETGMDAGIENPRFESLALQREHSWKYRGQVLPHHRQVHTTLEITHTSIGIAVANASLWADGQRIYEAVGLTLRIVPDA